jgi:hypothetical protein
LPDTIVDILAVGNARHCDDADLPPCEGLSGWGKPDVALLQQFPQSSKIL